ncbi:TPA: hypothetical protein MIT47_17935 [Klebsiella pneumoniae]|nr:hypothetical protein [Klebsiella pneumoniae]
MNISTVNELIQSLESAGELSIREQKFLKLAKAFKQLAAENVALKLAAEKCYEEIQSIHSTDGWSVSEDGESDTAVISLDGAKMVIEDLLLNIENPTTDRIVAGIKADGVEEWVSSRGGRWNGTTEEALKFAKQLREVADK